MQGLGTVNHRNRVEKKVVNRLEKSLSMTNPSHQQHTDITKMINTAQTVSFQCQGMLFLLKTQSIDPTFAHTHAPHINKQSCALAPTLFPPPLTQHPLISNLWRQTWRCSPYMLRTNYNFISFWRIGRRKRKRKKIPIAWEQNKQLEGLGCEQDECTGQSQGQGQCSVQKSETSLKI